MWPLGERLSGSLVYTRCRNSISDLASASNKSAQLGRRQQEAVLGHTMRTCSWTLITAVEGELALLDAYGGILSGARVVNTVMVRNPLVDSEFL